MKLFLSILFTIIIDIYGHAQCSSAINTFPFTEGFETSNGGWVSGGTGNDWIWGTPNKPVITAAGGGAKCWVIGGLTGSSYTDGEASFIQSPCYDFTSLSYPYVEFKVFWEMEQRFDGASFQYSLDNGGTWTTVGSVNDPINCLNTNWFNFSPITYLSPLTSVKDGWSGNKQPTSGSCRGGNGSNGWVVAKHTMPYLAGKPSVIFRFLFGAGTICNNYDGFAIDDFKIDNAPANTAAFNYTCTNNNTVSFTNTSTPCPSTFAWDFNDIGSGANNSSTLASPSHMFSAPGVYTVSLTVSGPGNAPSTTTRTVTIIAVTVTQLTAADCQTNRGGSLSAQVSGGPGPFNYSWNSSPAQSTPIASDLSVGNYIVSVSGTGVCPNTATGRVDPDASCLGIYFPTAFTPDRNGRNDLFGPLGSLAAIENYKLNIYNRWGQKIFSSTNPFYKWNGTVGGMITDGNLFVWFAEFNLLGKEKEFRKGVVMLIR